MEPDEPENLIEYLGKVIKNYSYIKEQLESGKIKENLGRTTFSIITKDQNKDPKTIIDDVRREEYISKKNMESLALNCYERFKSWFGNMHFEHIVTKVTEQMVIESEGKLIRENIKPFVYNALRHTNACRKLSKM